MFLILHDNQTIRKSFSFLKKYSSAVILVLDYPKIETKNNTNYTAFQKRKRCTTVLAYQASLGILQIAELNFSTKVSFPPEVQNLWLVNSGAR